MKLRLATFINDPSLPLLSQCVLANTRQQTVVHVRHTPPHDQFAAVKLALFKNRTFFFAI